MSRLSDGDGDGSGVGGWEEEGGGGVNIPNVPALSSTFVCLVLGGGGLVNPLQHTPTLPPTARRRTSYRRRAAFFSFALI